MTAYPELEAHFRRLGAVEEAIAMLRPLKAGLIALQYKHNLLHVPPAA